MLTKLTRLLGNEEFLTLAELTFSEEIDRTAFMCEARRLSRFIDAIVVSDYSFGLPTMNPIVPALWLGDENIESVMGFYIEHRNPKAIFSDVLAGVESNLVNVIITSYESPKDYGTCLELVDGIKATLEKQSKTRLSEPRRLVNIGLTSGYMIERPEESVALARRYGVDFVCPPETYDIPGILEPLVKRARSTGMHAILRTTLFTSGKAVKFARKFIPEMFVPDGFVRALESSANPLEIGMRFVMDFVENARSLKACGVYLTVPQKTEIYRHLPSITGKKVYQTD
ncbi:MAG: hypothetical protein WED04_04675 [Promethearchaeati archaeon SRVP18_Atabeyarchaeia-1]